MRVSRILFVTEGGGVVQGDNSWLEGCSEVLLETAQLSQPLREDAPLSVECVVARAVLLAYDGQQIKIKTDRL